MKVARAELLRRVAELGQRRDEQEKLLQRLEVRLTIGTLELSECTLNMSAVADQGQGRG